MADVQELLDVDLQSWVHGTRIFKTDDDKYFLVDSDLADYPTGSRITSVRRPTAVIFCNAEGMVESLIPDHTFPPGTTAEDAISELGYTLIV